MKTLAFVPVFGILVLLLFIYPLSHAQTGKNLNYEGNTGDVVQQESDLIPVKTAIGMDPYRLLEGTMQISYERRLKENLSAEVALSVTYTTVKGMGNNYLRTQNTASYDAVSNSYRSYNADMVSGIGIRVQLRNYLSVKINPDKKAPEGWYAAPELMYRKVVLTGMRYDVVYSDEFGGSNYENVEVIQNLDVLRGGVLLGYKEFISDIIYIDIQAGGMIRLSKYYNESSLTKYKSWSNIDYSGVMPTIGIGFGILM